MIIVSTHCVPFGALPDACVFCVLLQSVPASVIKSAEGQIIGSVLSECHFYSGSSNRFVDC